MSVRAFSDYECSNKINMTLNGPLPKGKFWEIRSCSKPWWFVMPDFFQDKNYFLGRMKIKLTPI